MKQVSATFLIVTLLVVSIPWFLARHRSSSQEGPPKPLPRHSVQSDDLPLRPSREVVAPADSSLDHESYPISVYVGDGYENLQPFHGAGWAILSLSAPGPPEAFATLQHGVIQKPSNEVHQVLQLSLEGRVAIPVRLRQEASGAKRLDALWFDDHRLSVVAQESGQHLTNLEVFRCSQDIRETFRDEEHLTLNDSGNSKVVFLSPVYDSTPIAALIPQLEARGPLLDSRHGVFVLERVSSPIDLVDGLYWISAPGREWRVATVPLEWAPRLELRRAASIEVHWSGVPQDVTSHEFELLGESGLSLETREEGASSGRLTFDRLRPGGAYRVEWYSKSDTGTRRYVHEWVVNSAEQPTILRATYSPPSRRVQALVEVGWPTALERDNDYLSMELRKSGSEGRVIRVKAERIDASGTVVFKEQSVLAGDYYVTIQPIGWTCEAKWTEPVNRLHIDLTACHPLHVTFVDKVVNRRISNQINGLVFHCRDPDASWSNWRGSTFLDPSTNPFSIDVMPGQVRLSISVQGYQEEIKERLISPWDSEVEFELQPIADVRLNLSSRYLGAINYPENWLQQVRVFEEDASEPVPVQPVYAYQVGPGPTSSILRVSAQAGNTYLFVFPPILGASIEPIRTTLSLGAIQDLHVVVDGDAVPRDDVPVATGSEAADAD